MTLKMKKILLMLIACAVISAAKPVMTNETVEAMLRGGVPVPTILSAIKTAAYIQLVASKEFYDRLLNAGASPSVADQIVRAMHDRTYNGAVRPEDVKPAPVAVILAQTPFVPAAVAQPVETPAPAITPPPPVAVLAPAQSSVADPSPQSARGGSPTTVAIPTSEKSETYAPEQGRQDVVTKVSRAGGPTERQTSACPIEVKQIHPHWLFGDGDPWGSYLLIQFTNTSTKTIVAVRFGVAFVDALADAHQSVYSYDSDSTVKPGKSSHPVWSDGVYAGSPGHKVGAIVWVEKLRFADDTFFVNDGSRSCGARTK
jgi:hypothetical protein